MGVRIEIPDDIMPILREVAKERVDMKRGTSALEKNHTYSGGKQTENDGFRRDPNGYKAEYRANFMGLMGEYAFGLYSNLPVDLENRIDGDRGRDFLINKQSIDVKATPWSDLVFHFGAFRSDIAVLARVTEWIPGHFLSTVTLVGWITKLNFLTICGVKSYGYGDRQFVPPEKLRPMDELEPWTRYMLY